MSFDHEAVFLLARELLWKRYPRVIVGPFDRTSSTTYAVLLMRQSKEHLRLCETIARAVHAIRQDRQDTVSAVCAIKGTPIETILDVIAQVLQQEIDDP